MTAEEIRAAIAASPELRALASTPHPTQALAAALSAGRVKLVATEIGNGLILSTIGLAAGNALLDVLNTVAEFRYVRPLLDQGRLDVSTPLVRAALDGLTTPEAAAALRALAERPDPVSELAVRQAIYNDDGSFAA